MDEIDSMSHGPVDPAKSCQMFLHFRRVVVVLYSAQQSVSPGNQNG